MKERYTYFNDKSSPSQFLGFVLKHFDLLNKMKADKQSDDIQVAKARRGSKIEIIIQSSTNILKYPKNMNKMYLLKK